MNLMILSGPIIGAVIGYFTNSIAVKMMFRPLYPVKIGNFTLPFTPGLIPKGKGRLAKAIGRTVSEELLTEEMLTEKLLSDSMKKMIRKEVENFLGRQTENQDSLNEILLVYITQEEINDKKDAIRDLIMDKIELYLKEIYLGNLVAEEVMKAAKQYVQGTFLSMVVSDNMLMPIAKKIAENVDLYMENDGRLLISGILNAEAEKFLNQEISVYANKAADNKETIVNMVILMYESFVRTQMKKFIQQMKISQIVEEKINEMDVLQVEGLVLSIMEKELNSVINLGAVIGFVIGLINMAL
ncbi:MAG: DUF445 family protein [Lachnospiraceae bacterium]|nr:DUF445 family protein [Lachnospiraceae bacterium]